MELRDAREVIAHYRKISEKVDLGPAVEAAIVLDDRIAEIEVQRDVPRKTLRMLLDILENINIDELRAELAKYDKYLPKFKDIIGLYADKGKE